MNILSLSLEESKIKDLNLLMWIISPEVKGGIEDEKSWILDLAREYYNPNNNYEMEKLRALYYLCNIRNYKLLIIRK